MPANISSITAGTSRAYENLITSVAYSSGSTELASSRLDTVDMEKGFTTLTRRTELKGVPIRAQDLIF